MAMREIKFRAWDSLLKQYMPNVQNHINDEEWAFGRMLKNDRWIIQQFTGLKDKNGKEIYEGDVIGFKYCWWHRRWWSNLADIPIIEKECDEQRNNVIFQKSVVRFDDGMFLLDYPVTLKDVRMGKLTKASNTNNGEATSEYWDFEVIGNIYENPELLKP